MKKIKLAVIDDGFDERLIFKRENIKSYVLRNGLVEKQTLKEDLNIMKHGTVCIRVLTAFSSHCDLCSLNIMEGETGTTHIQHLIEALRWCLNNSIELIHMSIGTTNYWDFKAIEEVVKALYQKGVIMVAACNNNNRLTYPAALPEVIGVRCDRDDVLQKGEYLYYSMPIDGIEITACGVYGFKLGEHAIVPCNSFTAPFITGKVCEWMGEGIKNLKAIKEKLIQEASAVKEGNVSHLNQFYMEWEEEIPIPNVVVFQPAQAEITGHLWQLMQYFRLGAYYPIMLSDSIIKTDIKKGFYKIEKNHSREQEDFIHNIKQLYNMVKPDVLLTVISTKEQLLQLKKGELIDVFLYNEDEELIEKEVCLLPYKIKFDKRYTRGDIQEIYKKVILLITS